MNHTMSTLNLTPTSYVVLGLVAQCGPSTSYDLKQAVGRSIGNFWSFPHAQLYTEPARLAEAGFLDEKRERGGRRRRTYTITEQGRRALARWLAEATPGGYEVRDSGLLKLFFADLAGDPEVVQNLAAEQLQAHSERLATYREIDAHLEKQGVTDHTRATLRFGLWYEQAAVQFWQEVEKHPSRLPGAGGDT